ncbi:MAG TPA: amidase family protein [Anaerolineae bacterium]|nr:amidase family protein [Anaerolineae bacterium]
MRIHSGNHSARRLPGHRRAALVGLAIALLGQAMLTAAARRVQDVPLDLERATVADLQAAMGTGALTSERLVQGYLARIQAISLGGPAINAVRAISPTALAEARDRDRERAAGQLRGPLHGIPVLIKDNIDLAGLPTTAGSLALEGSMPIADAFLATRLKAAGAVVLGKANLTEFANFTTNGMPSGYSSLGGQVLNPYDASLTPSGSSSGSAVAAAAGLAAVTVGTETSGSILSPAAANSLVAVKPTVGLVSRSGILPISGTQDTAGPMTRSVRDAALLLTALTGEDPADPVTAESAAVTGIDYAALLSDTALQGARIGLVGNAPQGGAAAVYQAAVEVLKAQGAELVPAAVDQGNLPPSILAQEFKRDLNAYLARLPADAPMRSLADVIAFNTAHKSEGAIKFGQTLLVESQAVDLGDAATAAAYEKAREEGLQVSRERIDAVLTGDRLDALLFVGSGSAAIGARAAYPSVALPIGYNPDSGRPVGITLLGTAYSEARLLALAFDYEQAAAVWRPPSDINPSLFRNVIIAWPEEGGTFLPALHRGGDGD